MEHDDRSDDFENLDEVLESLEADREMGFDAFLERRISECAPSDMKITDSPNDVAPAVEASSTPATSEPVTDGTNPTDPSRVVDGVASEQTTKLVKHDHVIIGSYYTEHSEPVIIDEELRKVYFETQNIAVSSMKAEEIIERFHRLERDVQLIRMQQQGLRVALEEVLKARTWKEREQLLEQDRKYRSKVNKKAAEKAKKQQSSKTSIGAASKAKSKGMKTTDTFKNSLLMSKELTIEQLKVLNLYDESTAAYVEKLFG